MTLVIKQIVVKDEFSSPDDCEVGMFVSESGVNNLSNLQTSPRIMTLRGLLQDLLCGG